MEPMYTTYAELVTVKPEPVIKIAPIPEFELRQTMRCAEGPLGKLIGIVHYAHELFSKRDAVWAIEIIGRIEENGIHFIWE